MDVVSHSPLPVASILWQPRSSVWVLTYVAKATFQLLPGKSPLAATQLPIHEDDSYWDDDPTRSLYAASDLEPLKPRVDVTLVGSAYAPQGQTARSLFARMALGEIDKSIEVFLDRSLKADNTLQDGARFTRMSLAYERAAGGPDSTNPVGVRLDQRDAYGRLKLPNLQPVGVNDLTSIPPVGFGAVAPRWPIRLAKLGRHASTWSRQKLQAGPVPEDFDWSFFNSAPQDQQLAEFAEDTRLVLENLHPQIPRLVTHFSSLQPRVVHERRSGNHPAKMRCDMLWIDTDRSLATMTFRGQLALDAADEPGRIVITLEEGSREGSSPGLSAGQRVVETAASKGAGVVAPVPAVRSVQDTMPGLPAVQRVVEAAAPKGAVVVPALPPVRPVQDTLIPMDDEGIETIGPVTGLVKITPQQVSALPFAAKTGGSSIAEEPTHSGGGLPFAAPPVPPRDERTRVAPTAGLPFVQTGSWPAATVPPTPAPSPAPPSAPSSVPSVRPSLPGRIVPTSPTVPPIHQAHADVAPPPLPGSSPVVPQPLPVNVAAVVPPLPVSAAAVVPPMPVNAAAVVPPMPVNVAAVVPPVPVNVAATAVPPVPAFVPPPLPVRSPPSRPDGSSGQTMGQLAAAAAATAAQASGQDGSSGVLGASNAAANASGTSKRDDASSGATTGGVGTYSMGNVRASSRFDARDVMHLIWYHKDSVARICKVPVWRSIVNELEDHPADDSLDDPAPTKDPIEIEDTRDIFEILVRATSQDVDQLGEELQGAVRPGGKFVPSLLLLAGELMFPFEERETLKATLATVAPLAGTDEMLKAAIKDAREFLASPDQICPSAVIDGYTTRLRDAYTRVRRSVSFEQLEAQIERALLEGRCYQKRQVLGMNAIRALLGTGTGSSSVRPAPVYLPEEIGKKLPLYQKFRTRLIVDLYMQEDQYEQHPAALKALAIGRIQAATDAKR